MSVTAFPHVPPPPRRPPAPDDLYRLRIPTDPHISADGGLVAFTVQTVSAGFDGYRRAIWLGPTDGASAPRQVTLGAKDDHHPRFSPDGRTLAFLSDRRVLVEDDTTAPKEREDGCQIHLLPLGGGEARRLTDLPRGVESFAWAPDGRWLVAVSTSRAANRKDDARLRGIGPKPAAGAPPASDYRYIDRLRYQYNGEGFITGRIAQLWLIDATTGEARRLTDLPGGVEAPAWSPDSTEIAFATERRRDRDIVFRSDITVVDVESGRTRPISGGPASLFFTPTWLPDGRSILALGGRYPENAYRNDLWLFAADGSEARPEGGRNITGRHDLMLGAAMGSDITIGEPSAVVPVDGGRRVLALAPVDGSYELWRIDVLTGDIERLTAGRHYLSSFDAVDRSGGGATVAAVISAPTELPEIHAADVAEVAEVAEVATSDARQPVLRRLSGLNDDLAAELELREPVERRVEVDGRSIQGWLIAAGPGPRPTVTEIHGGPHTLYGWAPFWEFQVLAGAGVSVVYSNPRGSEGYGRAFNEANLNDWGPGPMRDVLAGVEALVADGLADPARLGVTGGSYGGYLTNWIIAHDDRFAAAMTCRSVVDMTTLFLTGDISGGDWARIEFGATPWDDPERFRRASPLTYAHRIRTPLLIQHSERDLRTTIGQAEALFSVLRSLGRPVRLMRVPAETHELTRSGTPFRRVENLVQVAAWFRHFLVAGRRGLPPLPRARAGK